MSAPKATLPFVDLAAQHRLIGREVMDALAEVAAGSTFALGPAVQRFERAYAEYCGVRHCVGLNSGTSAVHLALICAGVAPGDEVITVPSSFIATCWGVSYLAATPVFVDIEPRTCTLDVARVEQAITPRTRALLPVHLYGQPADMGPLLALGERYGIPVVEDAAQAHGACYRGSPAGSLGLCGIFSFYPAKNLGAYGEAGALVTNSDELAARARSLRDHAQSARYHHTEIGFNYRMDGFQGAVLDVKLRHLPGWTERRRELAERYLEILASLPIELPTTVEDRTHVWHLFVIRHPERDRLRRGLEERGIHTGLHYPVPIHLQEAYAALGHRPGDFPEAERLAAECLSLPLFPEMSFAQQDRVAEALAELLDA